MQYLSNPSLTRQPLAVIVGGGPNLGRSIARKFADKGCRVAILARNLDRISQLAEEIRRENNGEAYAIQIDCCDQRSVTTAFEAVNSLGPIDIFVYNAHPTSLTSCPTYLADIKLDSFWNSISLSTTGPLLCLQQILPGMVERRRGTILFSGCSASLAGMAGFLELCCAKSALRAFILSLANDYKPKGVHIVHVNIHGFFVLPSASNSGVVPPISAPEPEPEVDAEQQPDPEVVAQVYWDLHMQESASWAQELDIHG